LSFNHNGANSYVSTTQGGILFRTSGTTERVRLDSSGNLLIGKTAASVGSTGVQLLPNSDSAITRDAGTVLYLNRTTSDGTIAEFRKDNTTVGSIAVGSGDLNIYSTATNHNGFRLGEGYIAPTNNFGNAVDAAADLGLSSHRFKDLRLAGTGYFGTSIGIGTTSPDAKLDVNGNAQIVAATGAGTLNLVSSENVLNAGQKIAFFGADRNTTDEEHAFVKSLMTSNSGGTGNVQLGHLTFGTSGSERVRIDSDGRLLVGKTSAGTNNIGTQLSGDGYASVITTSTNIPLYLENKAVTGNCRMSFRNESHGGASLGLNNGGDFTIFDATAATTRFNVTDAKILTATGGLAGIELGGVGVANRLDDYEEGTWTPTLTDGTTTVTQTDKAGSYVKVGNIVSIYFQIINASVSGLTGSVKIGGLPFTSGNTRGNGIVQFNNVVDGPEYYAQKSGSNTYLELKRSSKTTSETASSMLTGKFSEGTSDLFGSVTYTI